MDGEIYESYCEWAEETLIWGRGAGSWCRAYSKKEWESSQMFKYDFDKELDNHPLCRFGL